MKRKYLLKRKILIALTVAILIATFFLLILKISGYKKYYKFESRIAKVNEFKIADAKVIGWIQVQGTNIDYPVIDETESAYESGIDYIWRANTYREGNNREAIYGHNILNVSSKPLINATDHTRFEQLMGFVYSDFAKKNLYIQYTNHDNDEIYKIYAISFVYSYDEQGYSFDTEKDTLSYIESAKEASIYDYDVDVDGSDKIISLLTCTRMFGTTGPTQFRIDARKLRKNEKIKKYSVEINENYDIIK